MNKLLQKLSINLIFILILIFVVSPNVFAIDEEEGETKDVTSSTENIIENGEGFPDDFENEINDTNIEDDNTSIEEEQPIEEKENLIADFWQNIKRFFENIGFEQWLEEEFLPALPQSIWSLILALLVFLTTYRKNKQGATDIQASIVSMGLAKTSMDATNNKLENLIKNEVTNAVAKIAMIAKEVEATNLDMKQYKADLKAEIDQIKQIEKAMKEMLVTAFTNTAELVANGQAETIAKVASKYEQEKQEQETT